MAIGSVHYNQHDILRAIMELNQILRFDVDLSYGNGSFYAPEDIPEPSIAIDIDGSREVDIVASSSDTGLANESVSSAVFDPPFLTYIKQGREHGSIMAKRFGGYWAYPELEAHYKETIKEAARILTRKGVLVFKCQDIIHNHKMHPTHINVVNWSEGFFRLKDLFILAAKHRLPNRGSQKHARIHHSYFLVMERL